MAQLLTPAELIDNLLENAPTELRAQVLLLAKEANERMLQQLDEQQLAGVESGWADDWQNRHTRTTETLAHIKQALATC